MADALCGPSNALQNFQKHTSVDRTLQQDRLINRQSPSQGFRSAPGPTAGILDPEFDAFQAGHATPPQPDFHHLPPHLAQPPPPSQFAQPAQSLGWAADFQRLHISSPTPPQQHFRPQAAPATSSWHQDFLRHQSPTPGTQAYQSPSQSMHGGTPAFGMGNYAGPAFNQSQFGPAMQDPDISVAQGKQKVQDGIPEFDDAAFERAFEQAHAEIMDRELKNEAQARSNEPWSLPAESDPILMRIREKRFAVYLTIKIRSTIDLGQIDDTREYMIALQNLVEDGTLFEDVNEARWCTEALQKIADPRTETLIETINQRLMSTYPLGTSEIRQRQEKIWEDLEAAGYTTRTPQPEPIAREQEQEQKQEERGQNDDDEMAQTAGRLLESVADNTSEKFQKSQFLELMRRLRDREVRVEGDKVVETNTTTTTFTPDTIDDGRIPPHEQDSDLGRSGVPGLDPISSMHGHEPDAGEFRELY